MRIKTYLFVMTSVTLVIAACGAGAQIPAMNLLPGSQIQRSSNWSRFLISIRYNSGGYLSGVHFSLALYPPIQL
jgi:hypothetical protein